MNGDWLRSQERFYRTALDQHALPFWYAHGYDAEYGGFFAPIYADGHQQNQKSGWNQGRGLWIFSRYYRYGRQARYLKAATHSRDFFFRRGFDALGDGLSLLNLYQWAQAHHTDPTTGLWHSTADHRGRPTTQDLYHYPWMLILNLESVERQLRERCEH